MHGNRAFDFDIGSRLFVYRVVNIYRILVGVLLVATNVFDVD